MILSPLQETLKKIEECMSKYDKDMEALEVKITIMRLNYEKQAEKRLELEQKVRSGVIVKLRRNV